MDCLRLGSHAMKKLAARFGRVVKRATGDVRDKSVAKLVKVQSWASGCKTLAITA